jgi:putative transposase
VRAPNNPSSAEGTLVLRLRLKDKHAPALCKMARAVNLVWNFSNDLSFRMFERERKFASGFELEKFFNGASQEGLGIGSAVFQEVAREFVQKRKAAKKVKLKWRASGGPRRSLGWVPFKDRSLVYKAGQVVFQGIRLSLWDSYGLSGYDLGSGSLSEDARGRWYLNVCVKVKKSHPLRVPQAGASVGIDLGLKTLAAMSDGEAVQAPRFYRGLEEKLGVAQRAHKTERVRAIHAKIAHCRKDGLHKLSTALVQQSSAIFVGNVGARKMAQGLHPKSVLDAGWSTFRTMLKYKCDYAGVWFKEVDESYSTQECSHCHKRTGPKGLEGLSVRAWTCSACGAAHERDTNSAINIRERGLDWLETVYPTAQLAASAPDACVNEAFDHWPLATRFRAAPGHGRPVVGIPVLLA